MKTETEVTIHIKQLITTQNLYHWPQGFRIKIFYSSSRVDTRVFQFNNHTILINEKLKIKNIIGNQLEFWLCTTSQKIIGIGTISLSNQGQNIIQFKLVNVDFGKLNVNIQSITREIQKIIIIQPDQQLLKKVQDPNQKIRKQEEQKRKAKQIADQMEAIKKKKKPTVTLTQYGKKDQPFI